MTDSSGRLESCNFVLC